MPRKASGTTATAKANAKGAITATADGSHMLNSAPTGGGGGRGASTATRGGAKRRKNVHTGSDMYGTGTVVAANPFDDDLNHSHYHINHNQHVVQQPPHHAHQTMQPHHVPSNMNHNNTRPQLNATNNNKMMLMSPSDPNLNKHHRQQLQPPMHQQVHLRNQHPHQPIYSAHPQQHMQHQNSHYNSMQAQPMQMSMHSQMAPAPLGHMTGTGLPSPSMHHDHVHPQHLPPHQQANMHNQGIMMPSHHHQNYGPPSVGPPPPNMNNQPHQATQMIGSSTPPHMMGGPAPSHSPYNQMHHQQNQALAQPPHQAITPQPTQPAQVSQQPAHVATSTHLVDQMPIQQQQQQVPYATNSVYCGKCQIEVLTDESHIICKAGCKAYYHIACSGLTPIACDLLIKESMAEWACDRCTTGNRQVPYVKYKQM